MKGTAEELTVEIVGDTETTVEGRRKLGKVAVVKHTNELSGEETTNKLVLECGSGEYGVRGCVFIDEACREIERRFLSVVVFRGHFDWLKRYPEMVAGRAQRLKAWAVLSWHFDAEADGSATADRDGVAGNLARALGAVDVSLVDHIYLRGEPAR